MNDNFNNEIDFIEILKKIYSSKKIILYVTICFFIVGTLVALFSPIKYKATTIFIPQNQENSSSLSGVASLVGINLTSQLGGDIPPSVYPLIANSPEFKRMILSTVVEKNNNLTLRKYLIDYYKLSGEDKKIDSDLYVSELEEKIFELLSELISISVNTESGFITISSLMPTPNHASIVANSSRENLQNIIIKNKIESAKQNLQFTENQLSEKKVEFDKIQKKLSSFKDSNLNLVKSQIIEEQEKIQAEFQIMNTVVAELSRQVEQAKLQVSKDTPVFSTIKKAVIPNKRESPKRTIMVIVFSLSGFFLSILYIIFKESLQKIVRDLENEKT